MTVKQLAEKADVNYQHLCKVLNGQRPAAAGLKEKCAYALGLRSTQRSYRDVIAVAVRFLPEEYHALKALCSSGQTPEELIRELVERESAREVESVLRAADQ